MNTGLTNPEVLSAFLNLPHTILNRPHFVAPLQAGQRLLLEPNSPFWTQRKGRLFLVQDGTEWGRCAAFVEESGACIGYFEATSPTPGAQVLAQAEGWLHEQGATTLRGPMNGSTWYPYRFRLPGSPIKPFLLEPYNPDWYPQLWEEQGWQTVKTYSTLQVSSQLWLPSPRQKQLQDYKDAGYSFRMAKMNQWERETACLHRLSLQIFQANAFYTPLAYPEFQLLYQGAKALIKPENLLYSLDPKGNEIGFLFTYPENSVKISQLKGRKSLFSLLQYLGTPSNRETMVFKTIGVVPALRRVRPGAALLARAEEIFLNQGFSQGLHALMSDDNLSQSFAGSDDLPRARYALFQKVLRSTEHGL